MSRVHVRNSDGNSGYNIVIHFPVSTDNNAVGRSIKSCALANGLTGHTGLVVGTAPGDISQGEYDQLIAGDIVEINKTIHPGINPTNASVNVLADILVNEFTTNMTHVLKYYGHTIE